MLWLALKPIQHRHMVVSFVIIGELWFMPICSAGSRGVRLGPQNVETRWRTPSIRTMLALRTMRILAAKMLSVFCGLSGSIALSLTSLRLLIR